MQNFKQAIGFFIEHILNPVSFLLIAAITFYFIWGVSKYFLSDFGDKARAEARQMILWGVIGLFVMVSVWGLVTIVGNTFLLDKTTPRPPTVPAPRPINP